MPGSKDEKILGGRLGGRLEGNLCTAGVLGLVILDRSPISSERTLQGREGGGILRLCGTIWSSIRLCHRGVALNRVVEGELSCCLLLRLLMTLEDEEPFAPSLFFGISDISLKNTKIKQKLFSCHWKKYTKNYQNYTYTYIAKGSQRRPSSSTKCRKRPLTIFRATQRVKGCGWRYRYICSLAKPGHKKAGESSN